MCAYPTDGDQPIDPDEHFGALRAASEINDWERDATPLSLVTLDSDIGKALCDLRRLADCQLLSTVATHWLFLWAMRADCSIVLALEEIAPVEGYDPGIARNRRAATHPAQQKKLGHPTLVSGGQVRMAGELFLDLFEGKFVWVVNLRSGRYCRQLRPNSEQIGAVLKRFCMLVDDSVRMDEI